LLCLKPKVVDRRRELWDVKVLHKQVLCTVKNTVLLDILRRTRAVHLAYGDGILVVPTNAGVVFGFDLITRSLAWSYSYGGRPITGFKNSPPVVVGGKVVFAAPDGASVHCVDLRDGTGIWRVKRSDDVYLAGVHQRKVVLVG